MAHEQERDIWRAMIRRCHDPRSGAYPHYGARGVEVCHRWRSDFRLFLHDVGPRPSKRHQLDRIDGSRGYEPENCRWLHVRENANNKRNNRHLEARGARRTIGQWATEVGIPRRVITQRLERGWNADDAIFTPPGS